MEPIIQSIHHYTMVDLNFICRARIKIYNRKKAFLLQFGDMLLALFVHALISVRKTFCGKK